jgi:peptidylprolyl isomerase
VDDSGIPQVSFDVPLAVSASCARVVTEGTGAEILLGDTITIDYTVTSGADGSLLYSTYDVGSPEYLPLSTDAFDPALIDVIVGHHVGSTVIYGAIDSGSADGSSVFLFVTINAAATPLTRAEGTAIPPVDGLPTVTLATDGAPSIVIPSTDVPADLVVQTLIEGSGPVVPDGATITAHYSGWLWDGTQFDSSWATGSPLTITLAQGYVIDGWTQGLVGQPVGSQVLLIIPPSLGYGDADQGTIPPGSTLVFVVDILAAS